MKKHELKTQLEQTEKDAEFWHNSFLEEVGSSGKHLRENGRLRQRLNFSNEQRELVATERDLAVAERDTARRERDALLEVVDVIDRGMRAVSEEAEDLMTNANIAWPADVQAEQEANPLFTVPPVVEFSYTDGFDPTNFSELVGSILPTPEPTPEPSAPSTPDLRQPSYISVTTTVGYPDDE